jgi:excisionase family DNA binding protein
LAAIAGRLAEQLPVTNGAGTHDELLTVEETAQRLKVSPSFIYNRKRTLPFVVFCGRRVQCSKAGVERFIANGGKG